MDGKEIILKPCPVCGHSEDLVETIPTEWDMKEAKVVRCTWCGLMMVASCQIRARWNWNTRRAGR